MKKILMSACLTGENCKYSGGNNYIEDKELWELLDEFEILTACPEHEGGLDIPRPPAEIIDGRVINKEGTDVTSEYMKGAHIALERAKENDCIMCIMKESSPSCGVNTIYDGTFSGVKIPGMGCAAGLLKEQGFTVYSEKELSEVKEMLKEELE